MRECAYLFCRTRNRENSASASTALGTWPMTSTIRSIASLRSSCMATTIAGGGIFSSFANFVRWLQSRDPRDTSNPIRTNAKSTIGNRSPLWCKSTFHFGSHVRQPVQLRNGITHDTAFDMVWIYHKNYYRLLRAPMECRPKQSKAKHGRALSQCDWRPRKIPMTLTL